MTTKPNPADLKIDAYKYAMDYRELKALGDKIVEDTKNLSLSKMVFFDGTEHFALVHPYGNDDLLKVTPLTLVESE